MSNFNVIYQFRSIWLGVGALILFTLAPLAGTLSTSPDIRLSIPQIAPNFDKPESQARENYAQIPLYFEENDGQTDAQARYFARAGGYSLFLAPSRIAFSLELDESVAIPESSFSDIDTATTHRYGLFLDFIGSNPKARVIGENQNTGTSNYFRGTQENWITDVQHYSAVRYQALYEGIDALFYGNAHQVQYDFIVAPGANPDQIHLSFDPVDSVALAENGDLQLFLGARVLIMQAPYSYQNVRGVERAIESRFILDGADVRFELGDYDTTLPLVIDPVLVYAGYLGGSGSDIANSIAVDPLGNVYITGTTYSNQASFPIIGGPSLTLRGEADAFVTKLDSTGTTLVYTGYIGGTSPQFRLNDAGLGIAVDAAGSAYVVGKTNSSETRGFPVINGPDLTYNGSTDAFITKLNPSGTGLVYSGYLGGNLFDMGVDVALDAEGNAYITGVAGDHFPVTVGPDLTYDTGVYINQYPDAFVAKVNASGTGLIYAGYIGGNKPDEGWSIAVDEDGSAYVAGITNSPESSFPITIGPDLTYNGGASRYEYDAFIAKITPSGSAFVYAGYIGGAGDDRAYGLAVDDEGSAYLTGYTTSIESSFPVIVGPDLTYNGGLTDAFIAEVNPIGTALAYAGYIGGDRSESGYGIAVDGTRQAYISGFTSSKSVSFPIAGGGDFIQHGLEDVILTAISADGTTLTYSSYWGGQGDERSTSLALGTDGSIYITGLTNSNEQTFPVSIGADLTYNDNGMYVDAFVAKFSSMYLPPSGVTITESDGATIVGEDGATDSYTIVLQAPPTADVTITIVPAPQLEVNVESLVFTAENWNIAQTVTVSAVDDPIDQIDPQTSVISHDASGGGYDTVTITNVSVSIIDDDVSGVTITESDGATIVSEDGATDSYTLVLDAQPTEDIIFTLTASWVEVNPTTLVFTAADWNIPQSVTINSADDLLIEGAHSDTILHTASDDGLADASLNVDIVDNDFLLNLLNGGFETAGIKPRLAQAWVAKNLKPSDKRVCNIIAKPIIVYEGACVFQFSGQTPISFARSLKQTILNPPAGNAGDVLTLSAQISAYKLKPGAKMVALITYSDNTAGKLIVYIPSKSYPYGRVWGSILLAKPLQKITVNLNLGRVVGRVWIDDMQLTLLSGLETGHLFTRDEIQNPPDGFRSGN